MKWIVELDPAAERELSKIDLQHAKRILKFLFEQASHLNGFQKSRKELKSSIYSILKYRVGEYCIIGNIEETVFRVLFIKEVEIFQWDNSIRHFVRVKKEQNVNE